MHQRQATVTESGRVASDQQLVLEGVPTEPHQQFWKNCASRQDLRLDHLYFTTAKLLQQYEPSVQQQVSTFAARGVSVMF